MAATVRDVVRLAVTRTNHVWPLSSVHRGIYRLAIAGFLRHCARFAEVRSVYLRHGMTRSDWVPGLSDVDWTVVVEDGIDVAREHAFLITFWRGFAALKRSLPMLGEVDVLRRGLFGPWSRLSIRGGEADGWRLRAGIDSRDQVYAGSPIRLRLDSVDHALLIYANQLSPRTFAGGGESTLRRLEAERITLKIRRYAGEGEGSPERTTPSIALSAARALQALDRAVTVISPPEGGDTGTARLGIARSAERHEAVRGIATVIRGFSARLAIVAGGLDETAVADAIRGIAAAASAGPPLVVVTPAVFRHWLCVYDPSLHRQLGHCGRVTAGAAIGLPPPPNEAALLRQIYDQAPNVLAFPQSRACIEPQPRRPRVVASLAERAFAIRLHAEHAILCREPGQLAAECAKHYGSVLAEFVELADRGASRKGGGSAELHRAMRRLADEVGPIVERSAGFLGGLAAAALGRTTA